MGVAPNTHRRTSTLKGYNTTHVVQYKFYHYDKIKSIAIANKCLRFLRNFVEYITLRAYLGQ